VASLGGRTAPGDTIQGETPERKKLWANLQRIVDKRGRTGKKVRVAPSRGDDTRVKLIKVTVMSKKGRPVFEEKINRGDSAELADGDD